MTPFPAPPPAPTPPKKRRFAWTRLSAKPEVRSVQIGIAGTVLLHILLILLAPRLEIFLADRDGPSTSADSSTRSFEVELAPDSFLPVPPPPKPPVNFVEANPNAPDNVPDKTNNFAAQNQQVAQEKPTPDGKSEAPALEGEKDKQSTAIVTGQLAEPQPAAPPTPPVTAVQETPEQAAARREQIPLSGVEKVEGTDLAGLGSNIAKFFPNASAVPEHVEGSPDAKANDGPAKGVYFKVDPKRPLPRQTLPANVVKSRPTPLMNNEFGTDNIGAVAYNAKWSSYGEYLKKFLEVVQVQWERIIDQSTTYPASGTKVTVVFRMDSSGQISEIVKVSSGGGKQAEYGCVSAITARAPYGIWTDDMIAVLGTSQEFTFTFYYN